MVNTTMQGHRPTISRVTGLVTLYGVVVVGTLVALAILARTDPARATSDAWVHAAIVAGFALLLAVRLRAARGSDRGALAAVGVIATVLLVANVVEAAIPGFVPLWMRIEMIGIAVLMAAVAALVLRARR